MSVPVPFGQYVRIDSPVHRLDARTKIGVAFAFTIALFAVQSWWGPALVAVVALAAVALSRVPLGLAARGLRPIAWLLAFTLVANALFPAQRSETIAQLGPSRLMPQASSAACSSRCGYCSSCWAPPS